MNFQCPMVELSHRSLHDPRYLSKTLSRLNTGLYESKYSLLCFPVIPEYLASMLLTSIFM